MAKGKQGQRVKLGGKNYDIKITKLRLNDDTMELWTETPAFRKPGQLAALEGINARIAGGAQGIWTTKMPLSGCFPVLSVTIEWDSTQSKMLYSLKCGPVKFIDLAEADMFWDDLYLSDEMVFDGYEDYFWGLWLGRLGQNFQGIGAYSHRQGCFERKGVGPTN